MNNVLSISRTYKELNQNTSNRKNTVEVTEAKTWANLSVYKSGGSSQRVVHRVVPRRMEESGELMQ